MPLLRHDGAAPSAIGRVSLVGAGPGDPDLLTFRAARAIAAADVILHDRLVGPEILLLASPDAIVIDVGKRCGRHSASQGEINRLLIEHARRGANVVRLKGGDPFIFGRGGEEIDALRRAGVPVEIVPGVTAACAAAARLGVPLTQRGIGSVLHFVSGQGADETEIDHDWSALVKPGATYMGARRLSLITARMIAAGVLPALPAAAIENATLPCERSIQGTVGTIAALVDAMRIDGPALLIFGDVAGGAAAHDRTRTERTGLTAPGRKDDVPAGQLLPCAV
jgi:uroporphyrin-III C-methyltransferase